jgi:WD40 repeat protein
MLKLAGSLENSEERVWHAAWSPSGKLFASCGEDEIIRIWDRNLRAAIAVVAAVAKDSRQ